VERSDVTFQWKIDEIKLTLEHPRSKGLNYIFVEGASDIKLFRKLFHHEKCKVEIIPGGKMKLEEAVSFLLNTYPQIIGVRDADFLHLNESIYSKTNMFLTDFHDIEITMLAQCRVLNALFFEYTNLPIAQHITFRDEMMNVLGGVSCLKWLNDREDLRLKFKAGFDDLIDFSKLEIDFKTYLTRIIDKSANTTISDKRILEGKVEELNLLNPDLLQLTNGHDLIKVVAKSFKENSNAKISEETLSSTLRVTFTEDDFKQTTLYSELSSWATLNNTELFKS